MSQPAVPDPVVSSPDAVKDALAAPVGAGSLDDYPVLALAGEILDGGPDAYQRRRYLYGF